MKEFFHKASQELLLHSGQYALFYILMNFSKDGIYYFNNFGHVILLLSLSVQIIFLVRLGSDPKMRFFGSLIAPFVYTIIELREGPTAIFNTAHILFWAFSIITAGIQARTLITTHINRKKVYEVALVMINVMIFLSIYLYFDLYMIYNERVVAGTMTIVQMREGLEFYNLGAGMFELARDATHIYIIMAGLLLGVTIAWNRVQIISLKDKIHKLFGEYVDSTVRDKILSKNALSERKKATIVFSDIRGFTTLSETYTPEEITELLNRYFSVWDKQVRVYRGIIDKFIGDAVMIVFEKEQDAISCAESVLHYMPRLHRELRVNKLPPITIGIGIHTGTVIAGTIGSTSRKNYTVIGDAVNVASRLEGLCKKYNQELIISETTYHNLTTKKKFSRLTNVIPRGKKKSITIYGLKKRNNR